MRLFTGIELNGEWRAALNAARHSWETSAGARFHAASMYHITLAFLGDVEPDRLDALAATFGSVRFAPFTIRLGDAGRFGSDRRPGNGVLYYGVRKPCDELTGLYHAVADALRRDGWAFDCKAYTPHITMARGASGFGCPPSVTAGGMLVRQFALFESARVNGALCYTPLRRFGCGR